MIGPTNARLSPSPTFTLFRKAMVPKINPVEARQNPKGNHQKTIKLKKPREKETTPIPRRTKGFSEVGVECSTWGCSISLPPAQNGLARRLNARIWKSRSDRDY